MFDGETEGLISYKKNGLGGAGGHGEGSSVGDNGKDRAGESVTYDGTTAQTETKYDDDKNHYSGGAGGAAGAAGAKGGDGTLTVDSTASYFCSGTGGAYDVGRISDTERIRWESNTLWRVMNGVYTKIDYTTVGGGTGNLDGGEWYVVKGIVNRTDTIEVGEGGAANLVLLDRAALTVDCSSKDDPPGVGLPSGRALNIFGVASGALTANGGFRGAGIGGGYCGAGGTVTINGGVVTATGGEWGAGIGGGEYGADGKVTLDETKVEVVGGAYGNGSSYVKIAEKASVGPTCEGGKIELVNGVWVVTPNAGVTAVTIGGLPEGASVAVKCGDYAVPSAAFVGFGEGKTEGVFSLALDENGVVTIGGERIPVKPTIGELDGEGAVATQPFAVGKGAVMVAVRAIPGLKYALQRTDSLRLVEGNGPYPDWGVVGESVVAEATMVTLTDGEPPKDGAFYRIVVKIEEF